MDELQDSEAIQAWSSAASTRLPSLSSSMNHIGSYIGDDTRCSPNETAFDAPRSRLDHTPAQIQSGSQSGMKRVFPPFFETNSVEKLPESPPHRLYKRRRGSLSSEDLRSVSSASSNSKSEDEILHESSFEKRDTYWRVGASILHSLENVNPEELKISLLALHFAMEGLANIIKDVRNNQKAWSFLSSSLFRCAEELATGFDHPCHIVTEFGPASAELVHLLDDILRTWIRTVDPSICLSYAELPEYLKSDYSSDREKLSAFAVQGETLRFEEEQLYEIGTRIDGAFTRFSSSFSVSYSHTIPSDRGSTSKGRLGPIVDRLFSNPIRRLVQLLTEQLRRPDGEDKTEGDGEHHERQRLSQTQMQVPHTLELYITTPQRIKQSIPLFTVLIFVVLPLIIILLTFATRARFGLFVPKLAPD